MPRKPARGDNAPARTPAKPEPRTKTGPKSAASAGVKSSIQPRTRARSVAPDPPNAQPKPPPPLPPGFLLGSHLSIAGGMTNALLEAERLALATVQVFTKNQQQWAAKPLERSAIDHWQAEQARLGWQGRTVSHASYLINLASPDDALWRKSIDLMRDELERCEQLGIAFLVHHPGAFTGSSLDQGLERIAKAYQTLFRSTAGYRTVSCLENTAGAGTTIGRSFEELARLRSMIAERTGVPGRVGYCIDTCHAHAAGYDLSSPASAEATLDQLDAHCGFEHVRVLHLNDSKAPCASRLDRHEHVGRGSIGEAGFAAVLNRQGLEGRPMILETPKGDAHPGIPWDSINRDRLLTLLRTT